MAMTSKRPGSVVFIIRVFFKDVGIYKQSDCEHLFQGPFGLVRYTQNVGICT